MRIGSISFLAVLCSAGSVLCAFCPAATELAGHILWSCASVYVCACVGIKNEFAINPFLSLVLCTNERKYKNNNNSRSLRVATSSSPSHFLPLEHTPAFPFDSFSVSRGGRSNGGLSSATLHTLSRTHTAIHQLCTWCRVVEVSECVMELELEKVEQQRKWLGCAHSSTLPHSHSCTCGRAFYIVKIPFTRALFVAASYVCFFLFPFSSLFSFRSLCSVCIGHKWKTIDFIKIHKPEIVRRVCSDRRRQKRESWKTTKEVDGSWIVWISKFRRNCCLGCLLVVRVAKCMWMLSRSLNNLQDETRMNQRSYD